MKKRLIENDLCTKNALFNLTLSHLGDLIHSQPGGSAPLRNFAFLVTNETKFGVVIVGHKKNIN